MQGPLLVLTACLVAPAVAKLLVLDPRVVRTNVQLGKSLLDSYSDGGTPLLLTPYIEAGQGTKARMKSRVRLHPFNNDTLSYSGYFTVDKRFNANIFFWFFPAEEPAYEHGAPLVVWLQGGPGSSSMYGLFTELGPYRVSADGRLEVTPHSWNTNNSVLFFDNPVGTGFSYTDPEGYASNQTQVGDNLHSALTQFYAVFPEMAERDLFLAGESYAGKYVPAFAYTIHQRNPTADPPINLKGLIIGNGFSDPASIIQYSEYVYQLGLVDRQCRDRMKNHETASIASYQQGEYENALHRRHMSLALFTRCSGFSQPYNYLYPDEPPSDSYYVSFLQRKDVREALHVGGQMYQELNFDVYFSMEPDMMMSVKPWVEELLDAGYRVVYYSGQMDIIVAYPLSVNYYNTLEFAAAAEYRSAERRPWYVQDELAGYAKTAGNFTEVMVRTAGHMVPSDQPVWALDLVRRVTSGEGF